MPMSLSYRGIADAITSRIESGEWPAGEPLPTTLEIAAEYKVSEATAYRAMSLLTDRGLIYGEPGRGRFVRPQSR